MVEARKLPPLATRRYLRRSAGLTLDDLASQIGVSKSALWSWEWGHRSPGGLNRLRYSQVLDELKELL